MPGAAESGEIQYVWFDQDNTLHDYHEAMRRALSACLRSIHERFPETRESLDVAELIQIRIDVAERAHRAGMDPVRTRQEAFRETLRRYARLETGLDEALVETYYRTLQIDLWPFPEAIECLRALDGEYVLGILSNGMSLIGQLGIADFFEHCVYALEVGLYKPDPAIFGHALSLCGAEPEQCVLVGDDRICDVVGARGAGWTAVWLNPDGRLWDISADSPEHVIRSLSELPSLLAELRRT